MLSIIVLFASNAHALGLGEIQVSSNLGEPLKARVALLKATDADTQDMKVRLASTEEYKENNLQYPDGISFRFQIMNEPGSNPYIRITTLGPVQEPFLDLLVKFSSLTGKIVKSYTFLIDPSPDLISLPVAAQPVVSSPQPVQAEPEKVNAGNAAPSNLEESKHAATEQPVVRRPKRKKTRPDAASPSLAKRPLSAESKAPRNGDNGQKAKLFGKLSLSLTTSLSISRNDPSQPVSPINTSDALQEELIAKEKTLRELRAQIAEMQNVIKLLHGKLNLQSSPEISYTAGTQSAGLNLPESAVPGAASIKPKLPAGTIVPLASEPGSFSTLLNNYWQSAVAGLALLFLGAGSIFWYRKRRFGGGRTYRTFEDINELGNLAEDSLKAGEPPVKAGEPPVKPSEPPAKPSEPPAKASEPPAKASEPPVKASGQTVKEGDQSMKVPAYKEQKAEFSAPPEYDLLEEADIYLRFGHDKLAEEVLHEAIKINPNNPHSYLTLLGIYETRGDVKTFAALAQQLKALGDDIDWRKAVEMGRRLDPENPLYLAVIK